MINRYLSRFINLTPPSILSSKGEGFFKIFCFFAVAFILYSCETKVETIKKSEILSLPSMTNRDITTVYADSGKVQLIMRAPLIETSAMMNHHIRNSGRE